MTLEKAIEILKVNLGVNPEIADIGFGRALQLGIAAIEFIIALRGNEVISSNIRLPGETEE
ncbi:MAG TPA: hypothetical protein VFI02_18790 [Armatimonadota bacterium]|nr:hypothetical protein [Armatimonadota bacterium]